MFPNNSFPTILGFWTHLLHWWFLGDGASLFDVPGFKEVAEPHGSGGKAGASTSEFFNMVLYSQKTAQHVELKANHLR